MKKIRLGVFNFTCCEGCTIVLIEALNDRYYEWIPKLDIKNFRSLKKEQKITQMDIALVEGAISTKEELERLKKIRENSKILIAFGSGASNGYPSNQRNKIKGSKIQELIKHYKQLPTIEPLENYVKVDDKIEGCPVSEEELIKKIDELLKNA